MAILANESDRKNVYPQKLAALLFMYAKLTFSKHLYQQNVRNCRIAKKNLPVKICHVKIDIYNIYQYNIKYVLLSHTHTLQSIVIGPAGRTIQAITREASDDIRQLLNCTVDLTLYVRSNKK